MAIPGNSTSRIDPYASEAEISCRLLGKKLGTILIGGTGTVILKSKVRWSIRLHRSSHLHIISLLYAQFWTRSIESTALIIDVQYFVGVESLVAVMSEGQYEQRMTISIDRV